MTGRGARLSLAPDHAWIPPHSHRELTIDRPRIRPATAADAPLLTALARRAKASWGYPAAWLEQWEAELTIAPEYIAAHRVFVAAWDGRIVGCCALEDHGEHWMLEHVWIEPASQGRGIGRSLVEYALAVVSAVRPGAVRLAADPFALPFYHRLGARVVGERPAPMPGAPARTLAMLAFDVPGFGASDAAAGSVVPFN